MPKLENSDILRAIFQALYITAGRRTTRGFAIAVLGAITKTLEQRYNFLKEIRFHTEGSSVEAISIGSKVNSVDPFIVGKAVEVIVQVVYMDLKEKAGFYFVKELESNAGEVVISELKDIGVDLELLQIQQHYLYRRQSRAKGVAGKGAAGKQLDNVSLLGYSWKNVSTWKYDAENKICTVYGKDGKMLDRLDLDMIVKNYISSLTEDAASILKEKHFEDIKKIELTEKEVELLKIIQKQDIDFETAVFMLRVSENEVKYMVQGLLTFGFLQYISSNEVAITEIGIEYLKKKGIVKTA